MPRRAATAPNTNRRRPPSAIISGLSQVSQGCTSVSFRLLRFRPAFLYRHGRLVCSQADFSHSIVISVILTLLLDPTFFEQQGCQPIGRGQQSFFNPCQPTQILHELTFVMTGEILFSFSFPPANLCSWQRNSELIEPMPHSCRTALQFIRDHGRQLSRHG